MTDLLTREGFVQHRGHSVWWGARDAAAPGGIPLLTVHGGPGICHDCLEPLAGLAARRDVVFYDQYGCGLSDRAVDPTDYSVDLFLDELAAVRDALGLDRVHLFAHSYGGPLALEYLLRRPDGVESFTISNSFASIAGLSRGWQARLDELTPASAQALRADEPDPQTYGPALGEFITRFVYPSDLPEALVRSQQKSGAEVYARMHGSSWFVPDGEWSQWDVTPHLGQILVPTLVITGERDQCVPAGSAALADGLPNARLVILDAAHLPFFEVPDQYLPLIDDFLVGVEDGS